MSNADAGWVFVSTALVLLMMPGLALFYGGLVRGRAVINTLMMSVVALAVVSVQWVIAGYSLAFGPGSLVGRVDWAGLAGVGAATGPYSSTVPHVAFATFQVMFAGITVALISGAIVERMKFPLFILFALAWSTFVYDPLAHWVWSTDGWLHRLGALDFAGGTVVHVSAGTAALVAALVLGRRRSSEPETPHNLTYTVLGAALLWVGWLGFNAGSALAADGVAANALMTTHAAAAAALLTWMMLDSLTSGKAPAAGAATGAVVGLVAITPAAGYVTPLASLVIGALGAAASYGAVRLRARTRIDDTLDVFACHGVAGIVGSLLTGVFATKSVNASGADGLLYGHPKLLMIQALAVGCTVVFTAVATSGILFAMRAVASLRVSAMEETAGIDLGQHGERAYNSDMIGSVPGAITNDDVDEPVFASNAA